jgi:hypothetical protein
VVIEFRDKAGQVTGSIPSQRQIEAYHQASGQSVSGYGDSAPRGRAVASEAAGGTD